MKGRKSYYKYFCTDNKFSKKVNMVEKILYIIYHNCIPVSYNASHAMISYEDKFIVIRNIYEDNTLRIIKLIPEEEIDEIKEIRMYTSDDTEDTYYIYKLDNTVEKFIYSWKEDRIIQRENKKFVRSLKKEGN